MKLEINKRHGLANISGALKTHKGMLGISITNHVFSKATVQAIAEFGLKNCKEFVIVLVDLPERWNWPLKSPNLKPTWFIELGDNKERAYAKTLQQSGLAGQIKLMRWHDLADAPEYRRNLEVVKNCFSTNGIFRKTLVAQVQANLGGRINEVKVHEARTLAPEDFEMLANYLIEEIAGLWYLHFDLGYRIDIYPGRQMNIMHLIYKNAFPEITESLGYDWSQQGFIELNRPASSESRQNDLFAYKPKFLN